MNKEKLSMIELFSGVGMQKRGAENTGLFDLELLATSDIDKDAMVSYSAIHNGLTSEMVENYGSYPSREEMVEELISRNIGMNFEKNQMYDWNKLAKRKKKDIERYWLAMKLQNNLGDISKIENLPLADFWFYSSCCQDLSVAGKMKGMSKGSGTRSGLLWEVERLLVKSVETNTMPKYLCLENVKNMVSKKFKPDFDLWVKRLEELGYNSYYQILNGKNCGIPQNRERIFMLSIRKDIDTEKFEFPIPFDNGLRLKDILEDDVEEKYYINTERARNLIEQLVEKGQLNGTERRCCDSTINDPNTKDISNCITARYDASIQNQKTIGLAVAEPTQKRLGGMFDEDVKHQAGSVWDTENLSPTLDTMQGGLRQPCIIDEKNPSFLIGSTQAHATVNDGEISSTLPAAMGLGGGHVPMVGFENKSKVIGKLEENTNQRRVVYDKNNSSPTLQAAMGMGGGNVPLIVDDDSNKPICVGNTTPSGKSQCNAVYDPNGTSQTLCAGTHGYATGSIVDNYRIRKLTPRETFLLMGLTKEDANKCMEIGQSNSALYKQSGNGIITNCVELIFEHLYKAQYDNTYVCSDEKFSLD